MFPVTSPLHRELMQTQEGSKDKLQVDWWFVAGPLITIICGVGLALASCLWGMRKRRLNRSFEQWTPESTLTFPPQNTDGRTPLLIASEVNHLALVAKDTSISASSLY